MESSSSAKSGKKSNGTAVAKDLINLGSFGEDEGEICLSPQSNNFVDEQDHAVLASTTAFEGAAVSRGERQLIAH
ncbi:hypothetical protein BGZ98_007668 [Dissophora globulifera]|nr:hypothetical protein BGZ98_007668 [Dissophora globulifera]